MIRKSFLLCMTAVLALSACATTGTGDERTSRFADPGAMPLVGTQADSFTAAAPREDWWHLFESPAINTLVGDALSRNLTLAEAAAGLEQTRAGLGEARAALLPATTASASAGYVRQPPTTAGGSVLESDTYSAGFDLSYELDFFGRVRGSISAASQDVFAAEAARDSAAILVVAETVRAWTDYCAGATLVEVAENNLDLARQSHALTQRLYDAGRGLRLDVMQAQSALETTAAELPGLRAARAAALFRLGTLTGRTPAEMQAAIPACDGIPHLDQPIAAGRADGLIARRPDVRQADHVLAGAAARVDVATSSLYPSVRLGGSIRSSALDIGDLGDSDGLNISLGPLVSWSFPNQASARARIASAQAGADIALARFDRTVLTALQEAETALLFYASEAERRQSLVTARDAAAEAARLARLRYGAGADSFLVVLDAERTLANAETALARSQAALASAQIDVFLALGGGWPGTNEG